MIAVRHAGPTTRRAGRAFWLLVITAVIAMGVLTSALSWQPGPGTGTTVAGAGLVIVLALTLALRVMLALARRVRHEDSELCSAE